MKFTLINFFFRGFGSNRRFQRFQRWHTCRHTCGTRAAHVRHTSAHVESRGVRPHAPIINWPAAGPLQRLRPDRAGRPLAREQSFTPRPSGRSASSDGRATLASALLPPDLPPDLPPALLPPDLSPRMFGVYAPVSFSLTVDGENVAPLGRRRPHRRACHEGYFAMLSPPSPPGFNVDGHNSGREERCNIFSFCGGVFPGPGEQH